MLLADSHCHLNWRAFDADREDVVQRAREGGIVLIVNPGTDLETSRGAVELAGRYPEVYAAVGIHPNDAEGFSQAAEGTLRALAARPKVVAIGEVGMDLHWNRFPEAFQREVFGRQLALAAELELPVIVHDRDAHDPILNVLGDVLTGSGPRPPAVVMHSFSGGWSEARRALDLGAYLGFSGPVTYKKSDALREVVRQTPVDRLLIETDAPYLAPQAVRGRRNEPAHVRFVAEQVAELKNLPLDTVAERTLANARRLFGLGESS